VVTIKKAAQYTKEDFPARPVGGVNRRELDVVYLGGE